MKQIFKNSKLILFNYFAGEMRIGIIRINFYLLMFNCLRFVTARSVLEEKYARYLPHPVTVKTNGIAAGYWE